MYANRASTALLTRLACWAITGSIIKLGNIGSMTNFPETPLIVASTTTPSCGSNGTVTLPEAGKIISLFCEDGADKSSADTVASHDTLSTVVVESLIRRVVAT